MLAALSPYHITTREPAAMVGLQLCSGCVTLVPAPADAAGQTTRGGFQRAAETVPNYLQLVDRWRWSLPFFREGVLTGRFNDDDAAADVREACDRIRNDDTLRPLRPLMREDLFATDDGFGRFLELVSRDLLRGGPDPALSVPVAAAVDAFASRHALPVLRSEPASLAQRAEAQSGERAFSVTCPVLVQCSAERVLDMREVLAEPLAQLRDAIDAALDSLDTGEELDADALAEAADRYHDAFEDERDFLTESEGDDEPRVVAGLASVAAWSVPADVVLRSSAAAARMLGRGRTSPAVASAAPPLLTLVVRVIGRG